LLTFDAVTTYAQRHWESHAKRCVQTFKEHWGGMVLRQFTDEDLESVSDWLSAFKAEHAHLPAHNYRFDAVRFSHKVAAIEQAYKMGDADVLIWIDADCVTHAPVDAVWLSDLLGEADFGYLRRAKKYPECGFMMFRRGAMDDFLAELVDVYRSGRMFKMAEWHDSWVIEQVRQSLDPKCASLSGEFEHTGHPLINGPLGSRIDHLKGNRKTVGRSLATDLKTNRNETYWSARGKTI
jgi:hypothetical protein